MRGPVCSARESNTPAFDRVTFAPVKSSSRGRTLTVLNIFFPAYGAHSLGVETFQGYKAQAFFRDTFKGCDCRRQLEAIDLSGRGFQGISFTYHFIHYYENLSSLWDSFKACFRLEVCFQTGEQELNESADAGRDAPPSRKLRVRPTDLAAREICPKHSLCGEQTNRETVNS